MRAIADGFRKADSGNRKGAYDPTCYGNHAAGVFVAAVEATGALYGYVLDHDTGAFQKVATISSGLPGVMGLEFDRDTGALWAACDNTCMGTQNVLGLVGGKFAVHRSFAGPSTLPDSNNEGVAIAPESECSGGFKRFFWSDFIPSVGAWIYGGRHLAYGAVAGWTYRALGRRQERRSSSSSRWFARIARPTLRENSQTFTP